MAAAALAVAGAAPAQQPAAAPARAPLDPRPLYAGLASLPNWSGVWSPDWSALFGPGGPAAPQLTPAAAKLQAQFQAAQSRGENLQGEVANCLPPGMPGIMRQPYPIEFVFAPGLVYILAETYSQVRRIYTDGRPLPDDPDPFFNGHSVGRWEGDTLVVETIGLNPKNVLQPGINATANTRLTERIRLEKPGTLLIETTVTDPALFAKPFTFRQPYVLKTDWQIREYVCQENNRDAADPFGRPSMNIEE